MPYIEEGAENDPAGDNQPGGAERFTAPPVVAPAETNL